MYNPTVIVKVKGAIQPGVVVTIPNTEPFVLNKEDKDSIWVLLCQMIIKRDMYLQGEGESINEVVGGTVVPIVRFRIGTCRRDGVTIIRVVSK